MAGPSNEELGLNRRAPPTGTKRYEISGWLTDAKRERVWAANSRFGPVEEIAIDQTSIGHMSNQALPWCPIHSEHCWGPHIPAS